jgi:hypothetical protein
MTILYIFITVGSGVTLFWLRCKNSVIYGSVEIIFSFAVIFVAGHPGYTVLIVYEPQYPEVLFGKIAAILAAIYIFVRGMDNIDKGPPPTWLRPLWNKLFHSKRNNDAEF